MPRTPYPDAAQETFLSDAWNTLTTSFQCGGVVALCQVPPKWWVIIVVWPFHFMCKQKLHPLAVGKGYPSEQHWIKWSPNCLFQIVSCSLSSVQYQLKIWDCESSKACVHTTVRFVTAVLAVGVSITSPLLVNALSWATLHLAGRALGWGCWVPTTAGWRLIWLVLLGHKVTFRAPQELILIYFTEKLT